MNEENLISDKVIDEINSESTGKNQVLFKQLERLGFGKTLNNAISFYKDYPQERFQLPVKERSDKEVIAYWIYFEQNGKLGNYQLSKCQATLRINPDDGQSINL